jgi:hypothetical protein
MNKGEVILDKNSAESPLLDEMEFEDGFMLGAKEFQNLNRIKAGAESKTQRRPKGFSKRGSKHLNANGIDIIVPNARHPATNHLAAVLPDGSRVSVDTA